MGAEIVGKARAIRDLQTDLAELVRQDREGHGCGEQVRAARKVLAGDSGALAVLESVAGLGPHPILKMMNEIWEPVDEA